MTRTIDTYVEDAGRGLLDPHSRRGFIGRVGAGVAAVGAAKLFGDVGPAQAAARCGQDGCWDRSDVEVCYAPYVTTADAPIRVGPAANAPQLAVVAKGKHVGWQSTRNPGCISNPPLRSADNGYAWVYDDTGGSGLAGGWIAVSQIQADPGWNGTTCGPADADFDCRGQCYAPCQPINPSTASSRSGRRTIQSSSVYLRYAPQSTAFRYLEQNAVVDELCNVGNYRCVQVVSSAWAPTGTRGWVLACSFTGNC